MILRHVFSAAVIIMIIVTAKKSKQEFVWFSAALFWMDLIKDLSLYKLALRKLKDLDFFFKEANHVKLFMKNQSNSHRLKFPRHLKLASSVESPRVGIDACRSDLDLILPGSQYLRFHRFIAFFWQLLLVVGRAIKLFFWTLDIEKGVNLSFLLQI